MNDVRHQPGSSMHQDHGREIPPEPASAWLSEHDACAIVAAVRKSGEATHGNLKRALDALSKMGHRSGDVNGEGDGCGVLTDIPRRLWAEALEQAGRPAWLAEDRRFFVGHLMIPAALNGQVRPVQQQVLALVQESGADLLLDRPGITRPLALGRLARLQAPFFWQIAGFIAGGPLQSVEQRLFDLSLAIERETNVHVCSLSSHSVVYKVRGSIETLYAYYPELRSPDYTTAITLGHARYSTNTATAFERVQPFSLLGHNGEINTIARLREQAQMLGVQLVEDGSDSQDLDRTLGALIHHYGFSLSEAMELLFPPILTEVSRMSPGLQAAYSYYRQAFGPFAQGPAAIISRYGDECVFSVDALGLRPLWFGNTEKEYFFSSEKGVYHLDNLCASPRPLSPGEKMQVCLHRGKGVEVCEYSDIQNHLSSAFRTRHGSPETAGMLYAVTGPVGESAGAIRNGTSQPPENDAGAEARQDTAAARLELERRLAAGGWGREDRAWLQALAESGQEPISSIGWDGPLAALSTERQNLADYFKEAVAVVTNPSIDREREVEHFSTQSVPGPRPALSPGPVQPGPIVLDSPVLFGGAPLPMLSEAQEREAARQAGSMLLEDLVAATGTEAVAVLPLACEPGEQTHQALARLVEAAKAAVRNGARLILLDDRNAFSGGGTWLDPHLALAVIDRGLRTAWIHPGEISPAGGQEPIPYPAGRAEARTVNLRRLAGVVVCSSAIRSLHDLALALGFGADAVAPYLLFEAAVDDPARERNPEERAARLVKTANALQAGLEKVISTVGIHELRGYGRLFSSIGLSKEVAGAMGTPNWAGSSSRGLTWRDLDADAALRVQILAGEVRPQLSRVNHIYPKIWKAAGQVARGEQPLATYEELVENLSTQQPVALRHLLDFRRQPGDTGIRPDEVDAGLTGHSLPFVIASMSFGSQGEIAYRTYAQAAYWLNIIALNGEGGEIGDLMGKYPHNRGLQIASGRFGINAELLNSANLLEIKVGQGAKPGEGGHLPGRKVTGKVAAARHARPGVDLISPSNNHDIYSIEDLAQFIEELKTINPKARVAVKVPVVPGIGIIAVGIAKAGADVINLSGYDGGTGAARIHALRHVGLPAELGVIDAHRCLTEAGLRKKVELWCDGGMRSAADVVKMMCLGANRVGFGTLAMVALGCTICRDCQAGACHAGITTQIETKEQADALGLRRFTPLDQESAVNGLFNLFCALGDEVRQTSARLGFTRAQDLVGRSDLLAQVSHHDRVDLDELLVPASGPAAGERGALSLQAAGPPGGIPLRRPRNHLTKVISNVVMEVVAAGEEQVSFEDDKVSPVDRALGTHLTGALTRYRRQWTWAPGHGGVGGEPESWRLPVNGANGSGNGNGRRVRETTLRFYASSVPGNGLGAYNADPVTILVEGGAQDGVAKGMQGGRVVILKGYNHDGQLIDGSVGKSLAYGATGGLVIVQGDADSRACIRLSGADVIIGGEITRPLDDERGWIGQRANVKGFLCEYMTAGRVLVLGDPGPWMCAGMTGGVLYLRLQPHLGFDRRAVRRRIARGAKVALLDVDESDEANLHDLVTAYVDELARSHQAEAAHETFTLLHNWEANFVKIEPAGRQVDQAVSTE